MANEQAFLEAVLSDPDADAPRLVFADWLEEHGDSDRAEFIRVQCELARLPYDEDRYSDLQAREFRLLSRNFTAWADRQPYVHFRRGFLDKWDYVRPEAFVEIGPQLLARHPIRDVEIGSQEDPGWGPAVASCPHLSRISTLRLTKQRSHHTEFSDFLAILASPHLTNLVTLDASGGHGYGDEALLNLLGVQERTLFGRTEDGLLPSLRNLQRLSLEGMALSDRGVRELVQSPLANTLTHLDLSANRAITAEGIRALIASRLWPRLQELNLGKLYSRDGEVVRLVMEALPRSRITRLGLKAALFHEARQHDLPEALAAASSWGALEALDLSWNNLRGEGIGLLADCPQLKGLRWLNLDSTRLGQEDIERLADCPHLAGLTTLRVGNSDLTDDGLTALAQSSFLSRLILLDVAVSQVKNRGVKAFARSPNAAHLRTWILPGWVNDPGLRAIAQSPYLRQLTTLIFGGSSGEGHRTPPTDAGALALVQSSSLPNLALIDHYWENLTEAGLRALLDCSRLAWHGHPRQPHGLGKAYQKRFGNLSSHVLLGIPPAPLFPWSAHAFT